MQSRTFSYCFRRFWNTNLFLSLDALNKKPHYKSLGPPKFIWHFFKYLRWTLMWVTWVQILALDFSIGDLGSNTGFQL